MTAPKKSQRASLRIELAPPRDGTETYPPGTFTNVYAPTYDSTFRRWVGPAERPSWVGEPRDRQRSWHEDAARRPED